MGDPNFVGYDPTSIFLVLVFLAFVLTLQLLLCFKAKSLRIKLMPVTLMAICTVVFGFFAVLVGGWDAIIPLTYALISFVLLVVSGIGWLVWAIIRKKK